jgi:hypothetical protein
MRAVYARAHVRVCVRVRLRCVHVRARVSCCMRNSRTYSVACACAPWLCMRTVGRQPDSPGLNPLQQRPNREQTVDRLRRRFLFRKRAALQLAVATLTNPIAPIYS